MERRVFISHAVEDRAEAKAICDGLEKLDVRCWIAPRDIRSGATWAKALMDGVVDCSDMVLVLSEHASNSQPVIAEVDAASKRERRIIPVRIREVSPEGALEFYIGRAHWFNAFPESIDFFLPKLALEITGPAIQAIELSGTTSVSRSTDREKAVHVFFHASDVAKTSILATQIANRLEAHGWSVTRGYTELEIHSRGVWVHGSTDQERQFARRLLAQMGIDARVDDRAEDVPLQIIVGYGEHERRPAPAQERPAVRASGGSRHIEWTRDGSSFSSVPRLAVRLYFVENIGGTLGLSVKVIYAVPIFNDPSGRWVDNLFRFPDIAPKAREVFTAWFENAERLSAVRSLYLSGAYGKSFLEIKLLALAQAAEAFHRRFSEGKDRYMDQSTYDRDVFEPMEKAIPAVVNKSHRQSLRGRLRFGNEYSYRKRLTLLFEEHEAAMKAAIPNPMSWIGPLVDYRNTLTHHPVAESEPTTNATKLLQCNYVLTILLELCFLKAMGMDAAQIEKLAKGCGRYAQIRERFFNLPATTQS